MVRSKISLMNDASTNLWLAWGLTLFCLYIHHRQMSLPPPVAVFLNVDTLGFEGLPQVVSGMMDLRLSVISGIGDFIQAAETSELVDGTELASIRSTILTPVFESYDQEARIVGYYLFVVEWDRYFNDLLPEGKNGFEVVLNDSCGTIVTFSVNGPEGVVKGTGDLHDTEYDSLGKGWVYKDNFREMVPIVAYDPSDQPEGECVYQLHVYPTDVLYDFHASEESLHYALYVSLIFVFTALIFLAYDWAVARRQDKVLRTATRTQAIVASLFPENVQERILQEADNSNGDQQTFTPRFRTNRTKDQLRSFLNDDDDGTPGAASAAGKLSLKSRPIADLFPEATVIFAE